MADSILGLIAQPNIASPYASFQQGAKGSLEKSILENSLKAQHFAAAQQQNVLSSIGTPGYSSELQKYSVVAPEAATKIQALTKGIASKDLGDSFRLANTASAMQDIGQRNQYLDTIIPKVKSNPMASFLIKTIKDSSLEQGQKLLKELSDAGVQQGFLDESPADKITRSIISNQGGGTDIERYVQRARQQFKLDNSGKEPPPKKLNAAALEIKRAQEKEIRINTLAKGNAKADTAERIANNTKMGTRLAEIATEPLLIEAKGEITPLQKKTNAKKRLAGGLAKLANHYVNLDNIGAITNVDNSTSENVFASLKASTVGQAIGRITGDKAQSIRSSIVKLKPLILQEIRQSTNMGARGLDSEKELEFYMRAATDEKTDIQSNIAAIVVLDEAYGNGTVAKELRSATNESLINNIQSQGESILKPKATKPKSTALPEGIIIINKSTKERMQMTGGQWKKI